MISNKYLEVRFSDCDMMGHVNNAVYFTYVEEARIHFLNKLMSKEWDWKKNGIILKRHEIEYKHPVFMGDKIEVETKILKIKTSSFDLIHKLLVNKKETTIINSTLVYFDYTENKPKKLDKIILKRLTNI